MSRSKRGSKAQVLLAVRVGLQGFADDSDFLDWILCYVGDWTFERVPHHPFTWKCGQLASVEQSMTGGQKRAANDNFRYLSLDHLKIS